MLTVKLGKTEINNIRIFNNEQLEIASFVPPNQVTHPLNSNNTAMVPWNEGYFVTLVTKYTPNLNIVIENGYPEKFNRSIPVSCGKNN